MAENNAVLSNEEKNRLLYHLGYGLVSIADTFTLGVRAVSQPLWIASSAVNRIPESAVQMVRRLSVILDNIESVKIEAIERFAAQKVGEITLNPDEQDMLDQQYTTWAKRLSDVLLAPLNPYSERYVTGRQRMNVPVRTF